MLVCVCVCVCVCPFGGGGGGGDGGGGHARYTGVGNALVTIARTEGPRSLYRGLTATVGGVAPYTGLKFAAYAQVKTMMSAFMGKLLFGTAWVVLEWVGERSGG